MKLQTIFDSLKHGELSQVNLGEITEAKYPALVSHVNLGLMALFKRFNLKTGKMALPLVEDQEDYILTATDLLKVEQVTDADGVVLPLNDAADPTSLSTPASTILRVPTDAYDMSATLTVHYRASLPMITVGLGYFDPQRIEVDLPVAYLQALLYFVASRVHNPIGMTNEFNAGNNWAAKYEYECQRLENENLQTDQGGSNTRLARNGWV
jgi:hypothetical protein